jgi:hypothetical protein
MDAVAQMPLLDLLLAAEHLGSEEEVRAYLVRHGVPESVAESEASKFWNRTGDVIDV